MAKDQVSGTSAETIRRIAKFQAKSSREGGLFLSHKDRIKLALASVQNKMLANRVAALKKKKAAAKAKAKKAKRKKSPHVLQRLQNKK